MRACLIHHRAITQENFQHRLKCWGVVYQRSVAQHENRLTDFLAVNWVHILTKAH
jgi:hypothetical protein